MRDRVQVPLALGEVAVAAGFVSFGAWNMTDGAGAVGLECQGDHVKHQPGIFRVTAPVAGNAVPRRTLTEIGTGHFGLGAVNPFTFNPDALFEIANRREILIQPL